MSKTDLQLKQDIDDELGWDPRINAARIGVSVDHGAVTLNGTVDTYPQKWAAETATWRVGGVRAVAEDLTVKVLSEHKRSDSEVASGVQTALTCDVFLPKTVTAKVHEGGVTLEGQVVWQFEREAAERSVRNIPGVTAVYNEITLKQGASATQVKEKVEAALLRQATKDTNSIHVETAGGKVTLTGTASSWQATEDAKHAAWSAPGVTEVVDQVKMVMSY